MQPQLRRDSEASPGILRSAAIAVILLGVAAAYQGSLFAPFVFDDAVWITGNPAIRQLGHFWGAPALYGGPVLYGRPVLSASFALNYAISGQNPWSYHAANIAIHLLAALCLFGVVGRSLVYVPGVFPTGSTRTMAALAVALLWALHPLQTEAVTYVAQRAESLMGLFYLLALYCFIRGLQAASDRPWQLLALLCCLLGMGVKQVMVTAPVMILAYDRTFAAGSFGRALRLRGRFYCGLAACTWLPLLGVGAGLRGAGVGYGLGYTWWSYGLTECWVVAHYLGLALWPHPLVFDYGNDLVAGLGDTLPWAILLVGLAGAGLLAFIRRSALGFLAVGFFVILSPSSSVIPVAFQPMAESRLYLPLAAVMAAAVGGAWRLLGSKSLFIVLAASLALGLGTAARNRDYRSTVSLWSDTVLRRPDNPRARLALGSSLAAQGRDEEAAGQFAQALRIDPGDSQARRNLGLALYHLGRIDEALAQYGAIAPTTPDSAVLHFDRGLALDRAGRTRQAIDEFTRAVQLDPADADAHCNLARLLERSGDPNGALGQYREALRVRPDSSAARSGLNRIEGPAPVPRP